MDLEVRHLRAICVIAEAGSLSRAARHLAVSQPALTALLQRVERSLGGALFARSRLGVVPTPLGDRAVRRARLVLAELDGFVGDLSQGDLRPAAPLRLGLPHMECYAAILWEVAAELPEREVTLYVDPSAAALSDALAQDRLDIAVVGTPEDRQAVTVPELAHRLFVARTPCCVALSADHPLAAREEIELADLAAEAWIGPCGADDGTLAQFRAACRRAGFDPRVRFQVPSGGGRQLIESGQAVELVGPTSLSTAGVAVRRLAGNPMYGQLLVVWRRSRVSAAVAERVFLAAARVYTEHAERSPVYGPWWAANPEAHPRVA
ncbi:LysR family transcriptional regulator [Longispora sp. NPDC051575]|uniref:LysR family transcriptional regulator n=1 Tax=Longispora sp. NPDC051575 TaxID=3154943 RepID=UPI00342ECD2C